MATRMKLGDSLGSAPAKSFRERMDEARPDVAALREKNARKTGIAMKLRALRDELNMTQQDVADASGMKQSAIARMEALQGAVPSLESIDRYVTACGGQLELNITHEPEAA